MFWFLSYVVFCLIHVVVNGKSGKSVLLLLLLLVAVVVEGDGNVGNWSEDNNNDVYVDY